MPIYVYGVEENEWFTETYGIIYNTEVLNKPFIISDIFEDVSWTSYYNTIYLQFGRGFADYYDTQTAPSNTNEENGAIYITAIPNDYEVVNLSPLTSEGEGVTIFHEAEGFTWEYVPYRNLE